MLFAVLVLAISERVFASCDGSWLEYNSIQQVYYLVLPTPSLGTLSSGSEYSYTKLRIHSGLEVGSASLTVDLQDSAFFSSKEPGASAVPFGYSKGCGTGLSGHLRIDLRSTPFSINGGADAFVIHGSNVIRGSGVSCDDASQLCVGNVGGDSPFCAIVNFATWPEPNISPKLTLTVADRAGFDCVMQQHPVYVCPGNGFGGCILSEGGLPGMPRPQCDGTCGAGGGGLWQCIGNRTCESAPNGQGSTLETCMRACGVGL